MNKEFEMAVKLIRHYVERGDTLAELRRSSMGASCTEYSVSIGGLMGKMYSNDFIIVDNRVDKKQEVFKLAEVYNYITNKQGILI